MGDHGRAPEQMNFKGDISNHWKLWKQKFNLYLVASGKTEKSEEVKIAILLNLLGDEGLLVYNTFEYAAGEDKEALSTILRKFDDYCNPLKNLVYEHFKFFKRDQLPDETVDQFVTALRQLSSTCEFQEKDVLIRDRLVLDIRDPRIQEKLLLWKIVSSLRKKFLRNRTRQSVQFDTAITIIVVRDRRRDILSVLVKKCIPVVPERGPRQVTKNVIPVDLTML